METLCVCVCVQESTSKQATGCRAEQALRWQLGAYFAQYIAAHLLCGAQRSTAAPQFFFCVDQNDRGWLVQSHSGRV